MSVFSPRLPCLGAARKGGGGGPDPLSETSLPPRASPRRRARAREGAAGASLSCRVWRCSGGACRRSLVSAGWRVAVRGASCGEQLRGLRSLPAAAGARGGGAPRPRSVPPGAAAWQPGAIPHFVLIFRFICASFSFLSSSEREDPNKRVSLFLFRACKVEDV